MESVARARGATVFRYAKFGSNALKWMKAEHDSPILKTKYTHTHIKKHLGFFIIFIAPTAIKISKDLQKDSHKVLVLSDIFWNEILS